MRDTAVPWTSSIRVHPDEPSEADEIQRIVRKHRKGEVKRQKKKAA